MTAWLYIGNLSFDTTPEELRAHLEDESRHIQQVRLVKSSSNGRSRGFAFAQLRSEDEAAAAIATLNGAELGGRPLKVSQGKEPGALRPDRSEDRPGRRGGGRRGR